MTLNLRIDPRLERQLREQAARLGVNPDSYAVSAIKDRLQNDALESAAGGDEESRLLEQINVGFPDVAWDRYEHLVLRRQDETITPSELQELKDMAALLEEQNVLRIKALTRLAKLRHTTLPQLMDELQIKPRALG